MAVLIEQRIVLWGSVGQWYGWPAGTVRCLVLGFMVAVTCGGLQWGGLECVMIAIQFSLEVVGW